MATDSEAAQAFAERLRELMAQQGHVSRRNKSGVDVAALAKGAGTSYEMARRYVEGRAIPRPDVLEAIAHWLHVPTISLAYGAPAASGEINVQALERCIKAVEDAQHMAVVRLGRDQAARAAAQLYGEVSKGEKLSVSTLATIIKIMAKK